MENKKLKFLACVAAGNPQDNETVADGQFKDILEAELQASLETELTAIALGLTNVPVNDDTISNLYDISLRRRRRMQPSIELPTYVTIGQD